MIVSRDYVEHLEWVNRNYSNIVKENQQLKAQLQLFKESRDRWDYRSSDSDFTRRINKAIMKEYGEDSRLVRYNIYIKTHGEDRKIEGGF